MKNNKRTVIFLIVFCAAGVLFFSNGGQARSEQKMEPLKTTILRVGKADAIVVQTGKKAMVIDVGEEEDGEEMVAFLRNQGITKIDALIITHYDKDHVGGADTLVEEMEIERVLLPDYEGTGTEYSDFINALKQRQIKPARLTEPVSFAFGEAEVLVEPPLSYEIEEGVIEYDNNFSLITTITHGKNRLLFTGDIEKQRIREWISQREHAACQFLKMPHHGVYNKALTELIENVKPDYAVICSSQKNPAESKTLELLKQAGVQILQTKDGNITVLSDGEQIELHQDLER